MILCRILGWIVLLAGLSVLVRDLLVWLDTGRWLPMLLGEGWQLFGGGHIDSAPLTAWAAPVLIVLGAALLVLCRRRKARFRYRPS
jgi:hypothetical protein